MFFSDVLPCYLPFKFSLQNSGNSVSNELKTDMTSQMTSKFKPAWWLKNRHLQSCYATAFPPYKTLDFNKKTL